MKRILNAALALLTIIAININANAMNQENQNKKDAIVDIKTSLGDIRVKLYGNTPAHRDNFLKLVKEGYYDGVLFHRVIRDFMVQTGDGDSRTAAPGAMLGSGDPGYTIEAEIQAPTLFHKRGALAAARTGDFVNPQRRSSGSQFYIVTGRKFAPAQLDQMEQRMGVKFTDEQREAYINQGGAPHLDGGYTVFGEVVSGMDVVEKIEQADTDRNDRPTDDIRIISMKIVEE